MKIRRCAVVFVEPREEVGFDLQELLNGGDGLRRERRWVALAPHLGEEVEVDAAERELLGALSPSQWVDARTLAAHPPAALRRLLKEGLLIGDGKRHAAQRARDEALRATYWHPLAATLHAFTRWSGVDAVQNMKDSGTETAAQMREVLGAPPVEAARRVDAPSRLKLPRIAATDFDHLLARRVTCRNFDPARALPFELFAQLMQRVFAAQAEVRLSADTVFLKKNVPSGGGLHPIECYLIVQNVEGVAPGLYHYQAVEHALEPLPLPESLRGMTVIALAGGASDVVGGTELNGALDASGAAKTMAGVTGTSNAVPTAAAEPSFAVADAAKAAVVAMAEADGGNAAEAETFAGEESAPIPDRSDRSFPGDGQRGDVTASQDYPAPIAASALRKFIQDMVAQQHWFADAHAVVVLAPRFDRTFWKYRQHAKGYRVVALEAGHLSQTLYLAATDAGLGAFITGAINEKELEKAFGLDHVSQGALAVCGFGWRSAEMMTAELDPAGNVWFLAGSHSPE
ncbi:MAG TPA: putative peptide maturation dehydrogenase [Lysobacter sp.]